VKELEGKDVVMAIKVEGRPKDFIYNGRLLKVNKNDVTLRDVQLGIIAFPRTNIKSIREMNRFDMIELARKYPKWEFKLKMLQADDKVKEKFEKVTKAFRKASEGE
jgi:hypothetical protein